jgi:hypothetical protein
MSAVNSAFYNIPQTNKKSVRCRSCKAARTEEETLFTPRRVGTTEWV